MGLWVLCCGVDVVSRLLGLRRLVYGDMFPPSVLVLVLRFVVGVLGVLSSCFGGQGGHLDPLRVVLVLVIL